MIEAVIRTSKNADMQTGFGQVYNNRRHDQLSRIGTLW